MIGNAVDHLVWLALLVADAKDDVLAFAAAVFVAGAGVGHVEDGDAGIARFHEDLRGPRPAYAVRRTFGGLVDELLAHGFRQIDQAAAIRRFVVETRPARPFRADAAVHRALPAKELLGDVMGAAQQRRLAAAFAGLIVQTDEHEGRETAHAQSHGRVLEKRYRVVPHHVRTAAEVALGPRRHVALVDFLRRAFLHLLGNADGTQTVHVRLGAIVGLILVAVAQVVEMIACLADLVETNLADDGRIEVAHRIVQYRRHSRFVHQIRHRLLVAGILAFLGIAMAIQRGVDEALRNGILDDDVAVPIERLLLLQCQCGHVEWVLRRRLRSSE